MGVGLDMSDGAGIKRIHKYKFLSEGEIFMHEDELYVRGKGTGSRKFVDDGTTVTPPAEAEVRVLSGEEARVRRRLREEQGAGAVREPAGESVTAEADRIVSLDRQEDYGHPADNFSQIANLWSAVLGVDVTAKQAILCMILVKVARENFHSKRDNRVDIAGYAKVLDLALEELERS